MAKKPGSTVKNSSTAESVLSSPKKKEKSIRPNQGPIDVDKVLRENVSLRCITSKIMPCHYCGVKDIAKCPSGFPGCALMDDRVGGEFCANEELRRFRKAQERMAAARLRVLMGRSEILDGVSIIRNDAVHPWICDLCHQMPIGMAVRGVHPTDCNPKGMTICEGCLRDVVTKIDFVHQREEDRRGGKREKKEA